MTVNSAPTLTWEQYQKLPPEKRQRPLTPAEYAALNATQRGNLGLDEAQQGVPADFSGPVFANPDYVQPQLDTDPAVPVTRLPNGVSFQQGNWKGKTPGDVSNPAPAEITPPAIRTVGAKMSNQPVTLDMSKAQPIQDAPVTLDMSKAQPIDGAQDQQGWLDKEIPLDSYAHATESGIQSIARGGRDLATGLVNTVLHPIDTAKGIAQLPSQIAQVPGAIKDINQSSDPTGTYAKVAQQTAGQGAAQALTALATAGIGEGVSAIKNALPSAERAGATLQTIKNVAGNVPIDTSQVGDSALELYEQSQRGATLPTAVGKLVRRLTDPNGAPMTYEEAKDFQSNISNLSANEKMSLKPNQVRLVGQLNSSLKGALEDAADTVGKGPDFANAMQEYRNAMRLKGYSDAVIEHAWKAAAAAAGMGAAAKIWSTVNNH